MRKSLLAAAIGLAALIGGTAIAQNGGPARQGPNGPSPSPSPSPSSISLSIGSPLSSVSATAVDESAINFLHYTNIGEINTAENALGQLTDQSAITLAQTMIDDHRASERQVEQLASSKGWALYVFDESSYDIAADQALNVLMGTSSFDQGFKDLERLNHQSALLELELYQAIVADPDLQNLIAQTIPVIEKHLQLAGGAIPSFTPAVIPSPGPSPSASASPSPSPSASANPSPSPS